MPEEAKEETPKSQGNGQPSLFQMYNQNFRRYIDLVDNLRSFGLERELPLPQVAVLGVQSSGKSSVLEAISGVQLPRGTGIVTRCPLELRLKFAKSGTPWTCKLYCTPPDTNQQHYVEIKSQSEVSARITEAQNLLTKTRDISMTPITMEITSPEVPDLTLIDLPGITEVAFGGQDDDIVDQIKDLARHYIGRKDTLILVVAACNADLATTKALRMANEVDQEGERTIGVLTKVDLVDKGAEKEVVRIMKDPDVYNVRKGFTLVKLRSQHDIDKGLSLDDAVCAETNFFGENPFYSSLKGADLGSRNLSRKLKDELVIKIKNSVPDMKEAVVIKLEATEEELKQLGNDLPKDGPERHRAFREIFDKFKEFLRKICEGPYDNEIKPHLRLMYHTRPKVERFAKHMDHKIPNVDDRDFQDKVRLEIAQTRGMALASFLPYQGCRNLIQQRVFQLKDPVEDLLRNLNSEVEKIMGMAVDVFFCKFPSLANHVKAIIDSSRKAAYTACREDLDELFVIEGLVYVPDILFKKYEIVMEMTNRMQDPAFEVEDPTDIPDDLESIGEELSDQEQIDPFSSNGPIKPKKRGLFKKKKEKTEGKLSRGDHYGSVESISPTKEPRKKNSFFGGGGLKPPRKPSPNADFVMKQIATYMQLTIDRLTGAIPMRIHHHLITKLYLVIRSRMTELGSNYEKMEALTEDDYTRKIKEELMLRRECLSKSYVELSEF